MVRDANQILVNFIIHLLEIEHHQIGDFQQFINNRVVAAHKAVGIETGMNTFFLAGAEPVANKFGLQDSLAAGCRHAAAGSVHKVAIGHHLFHQLFNGNLFAAVGIPGVAVVAIEAAHQAALEEGDKADPRAIDGATGFKGVNATNC